jgi:hypothetical protein
LDFYLRYYKYAWHDKKYKDEATGTWYIEHKRFLFVPVTIAGETRWLEFARWRECWKETLSLDLEDSDQK